MKRALFIIITDYPGGAERVTFGLAAELAARPGWEVEVKIVCSKLPDSFSERILPQNVRIGYGLFRNWYLSFVLLPFRLMLGRYDLVFTSHIYTNALLSIMRRLRLIRIGRSVARESMQAFDIFGGVKARLFRWLYRAYGAEDLIIAQTSYMAEHVRPWLPRQAVARLRVISNPVNTAAVDAGASLPLEPDLTDRLGAAPNVLICGSLIPVKQPLLALAAFERLVGLGSSVQLVFLGSGPLGPEIRQESSRRGLQGRVVLLNHRTDPYAVMAACQYGLVTSANEGFPNVVLEMMACGLRKIVVTPCAGDLDLLPGVTVTRTFEAQEIADALRRAIDSSENCSKTYRSFAATRSVSAYLDAVLHLA